MALIKRQVLGSSAVEGGDQNPGEHTWENTLETANWLKEELLLKC